MVISCKPGSQKGNIRNSKGRKIISKKQLDDTLVLKLEFIIIYFILPIVILVVNIKFFFFLILILVSIYTLFTLKKDKDFNFKSLLYKICWKDVLILNIIFAVNIYLYTLIFYPELLFSLPRIVTPKISIPL